MSLSDLRDAADNAKAAFDTKLEQAFPGHTEWHWYRAVAHVAGENCRRNDVTSLDIPLATNADLHAAHCLWIMKLHEFYRARDGAHGFLGSSKAA